MAIGMGNLYRAERNPFCFYFADGIVRKSCLLGTKEHPQKLGFWKKNTFKFVKIGKIFCNFFSQSKKRDIAYVNFKGGLFVILIMKNEVCKK